MFSLNSKSLLSASYSCLMHDVKVACSCLKYHLLFESNPFSVACHDDLKTLCDALDLFYKRLGEPEFMHSVLKDL